MELKGPSEQQSKILWTAVTGLAIAVILGLISAIFAGIGWLANQLSSVLLPLAVAGIIAYLLDPVVDWFENKRLKRPWAIVSVFALAVLLQAGFFATFVPLLIKDTKSLASAVPGYKNSIIKKYNDWSKDHSLENYLPDAVKGYLPWLNRTNQTETAETTQTNQVAQASPPVVNSTTPNTSTASPEATKTSVDESQGKGLDLNADQIGDFVNAAWKGVRSMGLWARAKIENMASIFGMLAGFALVPVYVFYFLSEKSGIKDNWTRYLPVHESWIKDEIVFVLRSINDALIVFFRGQVLVAMCVGGLLMIGFSIIKLKYAVLLGFIAGVLGIVPYLGVMLSIVPAMAISIVQSDSWLHPAGTLGIFILVQMAEGLVISPKIIGDRVGMHPLTVIIAIMIGTTLMGGIIGGVLAIPLTAALRTLMFRYVWKQPVGENQPAMAEKPAEG
ncbi:MAG: AI-2E family transporter [Verrucomicrobia bacterium]|jgi:predicted PurR-regulated permease PerM|nr:AI-2E family transporter [Verrucomicrobiota bacterium]